MSKENIPLNKKETQPKYRTKKHLPKRYIKFAGVIVPLLIAIIQSFSKNDIPTYHSERDMINYNRTISGNNKTVIQDGRNNYNINVNGTGGVNEMTLSLTEPSGTVPVDYFCLIDNKFYYVDTLPDYIFELTNDNTLYNIKINSIIINVLKFIQPERIICFGNGGSGGPISAQYFEADSIINEKPNSNVIAEYKGELDDLETYEHGQYLKVLPGDLEVIRVSFSAENSGLYLMNMTINYTLKDKVYSQNTQSFRYLHLGDTNHDNIEIHTLPNYEGSYLTVYDHKEEIVDYLNSIEPKSAGDWTFK